MSHLLLGACAAGAAPGAVVSQLVLASGAWAQVLPAACTGALERLVGAGAAATRGAAPAISTPRPFSSSSTTTSNQQGCSRRAAGLLASLGSAAARHAAGRPLEQLLPLNSDANTTRHFSASHQLAAAKPAESSADDIVAKVLSCAAANNTETGVLSQLAECAMGHATSLTPEQIRNLCVSFAKLGYFNTQFKSVMADAVMDKLPQYSPALLADTAWAFGEALYYDYELMQQLHAYLKANAQNFDASGMAKMLWTFGRFGFQDETLMDMMHEIALKLQADCNSKALADVVFCMAQMGWADPRLHSLIAEYAMDNIQDFDSGSLAKLAFGLASVGFDDANLYSAITQAAADVLDRLEPEDVAKILWACGEQGHLCDRFMSAVADSYMPARMKEFTPQQLQMAVVAWNKLGFTSPAVAAAAVRLSEVLPHLAPEFPDA